MCGEAIALHTTPQIPERRGPVARLLQRGVVMDFGGGVDAVSDELAEALVARYPRLYLTRTFVACLVEQVSEIPAKGPRFTMAGDSSASMRPGGSRNWKREPRCRGGRADRSVPGRTGSRASPAYRARWTRVSSSTGSADS